MESYSHIEIKLPINKLDEKIISFQNQKLGMHYTPIHHMHGYLWFGCTVPLPFDFSMN